MNVITVLRSGGEFTPHHVQVLQREVLKWSPLGTKFLCLSDVPIDGVDCRALQYDWPGWWSKIELFRPDLPEDLLFTDLDNVFLGPLDDILSVGRFTTQRGGWTALMYMPAHSLREFVWEKFRRDAEYNMYWFEQSRRPHKPGEGNYGDAGYAGTLLHGAWWEDLLPGQVVNLSELRKATPFGPRVIHPPEGTRVVLCHRPYRPWQLSMFKEIYRE